MANNIAGLPGFSSPTLPVAAGGAQALDSVLNGANQIAAKTCLEQNVAEHRGKIASILLSADYCAGILTNLIATALLNTSK